MRHFIINCKNGRTLGLRGNNSIKYAEVVSSGEALTMMVCVTGGCRGASEDPMFIFTNGKRKYLI